MGEAQSSQAIQNLVMFMIYLAVIALLATLAVYYTAVFPAQQAAAVAPMNIIL